MQNPEIQVTLLKSLKAKLNTSEPNAKNKEKDGDKGSEVPCRR